MLKVAIVGCGSATTIVHAPALDHVRGMSVCALCDTSPECLQRAAELLGVSRTYGDYQEMLEGCKPDAVLICTPPHLHRAQADLALERGISVFCEKPMAPTVLDCKAMVDGARDRNLCLMTGYVKRFNRCLQLARDLIGKGALGRLLSVDVKWFFGGGLAPRTSKLWKDSEVACGGVVQDVGSHLIDTLLWWNGPVRAVVAQMSIAGANANTEDNGEILLLHRNGVSSHISINGLSNEGIIESYRLVGTEQTLGLEMRNRESFAVLDPFVMSLSSRSQAGYCTLDITPTSCRELSQEIDQHSQSVQQMRCFVDSCSRGRFDDVLACQGLRVAEVVDAAYCSALAGRSVDVPSDAASSYRGLFGPAGELRKRRDARA